MINMSSSDKITEILKRYSTLAEEETAELFYKPTTNHEGSPRFICQSCGRMKMCGKASVVTFYRLNKSILLFCDNKCFSHWLRHNHTVCWRTDLKHAKCQQHPIETTPDLNALSPQQKYEQYLAKCRLKGNEKYKNLTEAQKTQRRAKARERYRRNHPWMDLTGKRDPKGRFIKK
jgi:hypothetical protein